MPAPDLYFIIFGVLAVLMTFLLTVYALRASRTADRLRERLEVTKLSLVTAEARASEVPHLQDRLDDLNLERSRLEREASAFEARLAEREKSITDMKERMDVDFRSAASKMLGEAHQAFLQRADETFKRHQEAAGADAEKRRRAIDDLVKPMRETLTRYETGLTEMRHEQQKARGELTGRIGDLAKSANDVRIEAQKLSTALRAGPKVRGRWGEEQLRNVVEIAGMTAYVDFEEQKSHHDGERRKQPDMIVRLPGDRVIAVDSKVSLNAYLDALEAETDAARTMHLQKHSNDIWAHVKALSAKEYATSLKDSLDFVVMFVPGESYFSAAMEARPQLFQDAFDRKILIATPTTLVAILKSSAYGWRQEKAAQNAQVVAGMASELYESLRTMGAHLTGLGKSLEGAVKKYNDLLGGVESRVMPRARKFAEYELPGVEGEIETRDLIETAPRQVREGRDLLLTSESETDKSAA